MHFHPTGSLVEDVREEIIVLHHIGDDNFDKRILGVYAMGLWLLDTSRGCRFLLHSVFAMD